MGELRLVMINDVPANNNGHGLIMRSSQLKADALDSSGCICIKLRRTSRTWRADVDLLVRDANSSILLVYILF